MVDVALGDDDGPAIEVLEADPGRELLQGPYVLEAEPAAEAPRHHRGSVHHREMLDVPDGGVLRVALHGDVVVAAARARGVERRPPGARGGWTEEGPADRQVGIRSARSASVGARRARQQGQRRRGKDRGDRSAEDPQGVWRALSSASKSVPTTSI